MTDLVVVMIWKVGLFYTAVSTLNSIPASVLSAKIGFFDSWANFFDFTGCELQFEIIIIHGS